MPPYIQHATENLDSIEVSGAAQTLQEFVTTNVTKLDDLDLMRVKPDFNPSNYYYFTEASFADLDVENETAHLNLNLTENNTLVSRNELVYLHTRLSGASEQDHDTLKIWQQPMYPTADNSYLWYYGVKVRYHVKVKSDYEYDTSIDLRFDCGTIPISCSRNGDVLTITGSYTSGNETYNLNLTKHLSVLLNSITITNNGSRTPRLPL